MLTSLANRGREFARLNIVRSTSLGPMFAWFASGIVPGGYRPSLRMCGIALVCLVTGCTQVVAERPASESLQGTQPEFVLDEVLETPASVNQYLTFLFDAPVNEDRAREFLEIYKERRDEFRPWNSRLLPNFGYRTKPIWAKLLIRSTSERRRLLRFEIVNPDLEHVDIFFVSPPPSGMKGQSVRREQIGSWDRDSPRQEFRRFPMHTIQVDPGKTYTLLMRIETVSPLWITTQAIDRQFHGPYAIKRLILDQPIIWFSAFAAFLSLILAGIFRKRLFLYNSLFAASYFLYYISRNGYLRNFWEEAPDWLQPQIRMTTTLVCFFAILSFTQLYFQQPLKQNLLLRRLAWTFRGISLALIPFSLSLPRVQAEYVVHIAAIVSILWITFLTLYGTRRPFQRSKIYFFVAWLCFGTTSLFMQLQLAGWVPMPISPLFLEMATVVPIVTLFFVATSGKTKETEEMELEVSRAMEAESNARLAALRYQINPHFLFNTLTSIDALSRISPEKVPNLIERLAAYLRPRLEPGEHPFVKLAAELTAIQAYLEIEQIRFGNDLKLTWNIAPEAMLKMVPDGILQPIVENAIKHRPTDRDEVEINLAAAQVNGRIEIRIANRGVLRPEEDCPSRLAARSGIGLENVRRRLFAHFGGSADLALMQDNEWVVCVLTLPIVEPEANPR